MDVQRKVEILADAAKYDASCASSGAKRTGAGGLGNSTGVGICHSYTPDGRCVSLLKILLTNYCIFDCRFCVNRASSATPRARFSVDEIVQREAVRSLLIERLLGLPTQEMAQGKQLLVAQVRIARHAVLHA